MHKLVEGASVVRATLHSSKPLWLHLYAVPYVAVVWGSVGLAWALVGDAVHEDLWLLVGILASLAHALSWLACFWSVDFKTMATCTSLQDPYTAQMIKVVPAEHRGAVELCPLQTDKVLRGELT